ncbi:MAG: YdiU family protein [Salaquimonas sp.]
MNIHTPKFDFDNTYARELGGFYVPWQGERAPKPEIRIINSELALELGMATCQLESPQGASILSGSALPEGSSPLAQVYAGHQFGGFSEQLGDGRALLLGELLDKKGNRRDIQLKGSGRTPFSRNGDGKAALGPVLREYLMGEAMHALGIPTTRALAVVTTGENIVRDGLQPGAVLTRVASSHIRVGTFQFFAARGEMEKVRKLADYAIARHYPALKDRKTKYLDFLAAVVTAQAELTAHWMRVGFVHGVINTDNVAISGETIDYGPCAFIDKYDPKAVFSSIDREGRYAYGNQPIIARWNLARLADTLLPLIDTDDLKAVELASAVINKFPEQYLEFWLTEMSRKIGLTNRKEQDVDLVNDLFASMEGQGVDYTLFFRSLSQALEGNLDNLIALFDDPTKITHWLTKWQDRLSFNPVTPETRRAIMETTNPIYIPRNHNVEEALLAAWKDGDLTPFKILLDALSKPFTKRAGLEKFEQPAPEEFGPYKTFCGT